MLSTIKAFFQSESARDRNGGHDERELHIAAAGLLVEAAMTDGNIDTSERDRIAGLIEKHFEIPRAEATEILSLSEARAEQAVDIYGFLKVINQRFEHEERIRLIEMLWDIAYSDGELHDHEANLARRVSGMLGLTDVENGAARKRVLARLEG